MPPLAVALALAAVTLGPAGALPDPLLGFVDEFVGTSTGTWAGGTPFSNPGTGGHLGPGDGYLLLENSAPAPLGARSNGPGYTGNWTASGITQVRVWLNDVGAANPVSIHFSIGNSLNFWQCNTGFSPPLHQWAEFTVDLTATGNFTRIIGNGTFAQALSSVDRIHFRHDLAPYTQFPDPVQGDVGIDGVLLTNPATEVHSTTWGRIKALYR